MAQLSVRMPEEMASRLDARGDRSAVIRDTLDRYFALLDRARAGLRGAFTEAEVSLLADATNGVRHEAWSVPLLAHGVADAIALDGLDAKWGVDGGALLARLRGLGLAETFALVDALERHWGRVGAGEQPPIAGLLAP